MTYDMKPELKPGLCGTLKLLKLLTGSLKGLEEPGSVQATLHTPLYNVRLCRDDQIAACGVGSAGLSRRLRELQRSAGLKGCFQNYPFVMAQEVCSLVSFFTSYEFFKMKMTTYVRSHLDASGEKDIYAWTTAACGSGILLAAVGTPFENLLAWHVARRDQRQPRSSLAKEAS